MKINSDICISLQLLYELCIIFELLYRLSFYRVSHLVQYIYDCTECLRLSSATSKHSVQYIQNYTEC
jgi:hypothetical protein